MKICHYLYKKVVKYVSKIVKYANGMENSQKYFEPKWRLTAQVAVNGVVRRFFCWNVLALLSGG